jgi:hypothetical protein
MGPLRLVAVVAWAFDMFALLAQRFSRNTRLLSTIKLVCQAYSTHFVFLGNFTKGQTAS